MSELTHALGRSTIVEGAEIIIEELGLTTIDDLECLFDTKGEACELDQELNGLGHFREALVC